MPGIGGARFRRITGRAAAEELAPRLATGRHALGVLDARPATADWLVADAPTIADISVSAYALLALEAGIDLGHFSATVAWAARPEALPRWRGDLAPCAPNARPGEGHSIYGPT